MPPDDRDAEYLLDMLWHARGVVQAVHGRTFEEYVTDEDVRLVVERPTEIIGDAARRVTTVGVPERSALLEPLVPSPEEDAWSSSPPIRRCVPAIALGSCAF